MLRRQLLEIKALQTNPPDRKQKETYHPHPSPEPATFETTLIHSFCFPKIPDLPLNHTTIQSYASTPSPSVNPNDKDDLSKSQAPPSSSSLPSGDA
jgi:hypothetical protein